MAPQTVATVRRATPGDGAASVEVMLAARHAAVPAIPPLVHTDDEVRRWFVEVVLAEAEVWVADRAGSILGVLVLDGGWVEQLYVTPRWHGQGVGSALLGVAKRERPAGLDLWTFQSNDGARRFYERHGFVEIDRTDGDNEEGAPDIRFRWDGHRSSPPTVPGAELSRRARRR